MTMKQWVFLLIALLAVPAVFAQSGNIKLLAMIEIGNESKGALADLTLDIKQGSQRVFLETFPLTKITTQVSLRFAQQISCNEFEIDCSELDFFYTISALPGIVGGPSAGSAAAILTAALLNGDEWRNDVGITGTINSGGLIGPVGGIKQKIKAASKNDIKLVLIPRGTAEAKEKDNTTTDLIEYGKEFGIEVREIATLAEAYEIYTGRVVYQEDGEFVLDADYETTMQQVAQDLCKRRDAISAKLEQELVEENSNISSKKELAQNYTKRAKESLENSEYYSTASYCFRSNVILKQTYFSLFNYSKEELAKAVLGIKKKSNELAEELESKPVTTLNALQTFMAVEERLSEVDETLFEVINTINDTKKAAELVAYAEERLYSAVSWSKFFDTGKTYFVLDEERIHSSCLSKIGEAEERYNYVKTFLENSLTNVVKDLQSAYHELQNKSYVMCLYKAAQSKAQADVILSVVGVSEERLDELIELKQDIVRKSLIKSQKQGIFPLIGYSYYEYSRSLADFDKFSALLFSEYALEFSSLDIYFEEKKLEKKVVPKIDKKLIIVFLIGLILGIAIMLPRKSRASISRQTLQTPPKKRLRGKKR